jgi:predicted translin family RNA/ssDNA-binding protein
MNRNHYDKWEAERTQEARDYTIEYLKDFRDSITGHIQITYSSNYTKHTKEYVLAKVYHMLLSHGIVMNYNVTKRRNRTYIKIDLIADSDPDSDLDE